MSYSDSTIPVETILATAKLFRKDIKGHRKADFHDYERFKQTLHENGHYGYEKELADILGV